MLLELVPTGQTQSYRIALQLWQFLLAELLDNFLLVLGSVVSIADWLPVIPLSMTVAFVIPGFYYLTQSSRIVDIPCHSEWLDAIPIPFGIICSVMKKSMTWNIVPFLALSVYLPVLVQWNISRLNCVLNAMSVVAFLQFPAMLWCQWFIKTLLIKGRFCLQCCLLYPHNHPRRYRTYFSLIESLIRS